MSKQDTIILNRNNPVSITFNGVDLTLFNKIEVAFGGDVRNSVDNSDSVIVSSATVLELKFGDTEERLPNFWRVTGFDNVNVSGLDLVSECIGNLPPSPVCI